jgi:hypothetical protein
MATYVYAFSELCRIYIFLPIVRVAYRSADYMKKKGSSMKSVSALVSIILAVVLLQPAEAAAQERVQPFASGTPTWVGVPSELGPPRSAYTASAGHRGPLGAVAGGVAGLALGAGIGYLLYKDETAGCDDGICGWVPSMIIGGATGLVVGGWIGYRIAVRPKR